MSYMELRDQQSARPSAARADAAFESGALASTAPTDRFQGQTFNRGAYS
jgi:hypothetical protein